MRAVLTIALHCSDFRPVLLMHSAVTSFRRSPARDTIWRLIFWLSYAILCRNLSKQVIEMKINKNIAKRMSKLQI